MQTRQTSLHFWLSDTDLTIAVAHTLLHKHCCTNVLAQNALPLFAKQGHGCRLEILHAGEWGTITNPKVMLLKLAFCGCVSDCGRITL